MGNDDLHRRREAFGNGRLKRLIAGLCAVLAVTCAFTPAIGDAALDPKRCQRGEPLRVVAFGDSLTAGFGLPARLSFPSQLNAALTARGHDVIVRNAGVSGDTTAGGLKRFDWAIPADTDAVILELGANDVLRGLPVAQARKNLDQIIRKLKDRRIAVLITGMRALRNWGADYEAEFNAMFDELATTHKTLLYPFFLEGVALNRGLNLPDGLHPNGEGIGKIVERIIPHVEDLMERARSFCGAGMKKSALGVRLRPSD